jgi:hypothetical protein
MATRFKVELEDGSELVIKVKPKHILRSERAGNNEASAESTYRLAWMASESDVSFDEWMDMVDDIEPLFDSVEDDAVPPTIKGSRGSRSVQA